MHIEAKSVLNGNLFRKICKSFNIQLMRCVDRILQVSQCFLTAFSL
jgi:hypothetical protein